MPLDFTSPPSTTIIIGLSDYGQKPLNYTATASTSESAVADSLAKTLSNRLKAISGLKVESLTVRIEYSEVDSDAGGNIDQFEFTGAFVMETASGQHEVIEIAGFKPELTNGQYILASESAVQNFVNLFLLGNVYGELGPVVEILEGFVFIRGNDRR